MSASTATAASTGNSLVPLISEQYRIIKRLGGGRWDFLYGQLGLRIVNAHTLLFEAEGTLPIQ